MQRSLQAYFLWRVSDIKQLLITAALVIVTSLLFVGLISYPAKSKIQELENSKDRGKVSWYVAMAKANGQREVIIGAPVVTYAVPDNLDDALAYYSLVVVEPLEQRSYVENERLTSWYKFRLIEELSAPTAKCIYCPDIEPAPSDMLPLKANEFLVSKAEGEVEVDGIRVITHDRDFPGFEKGKRYLIFLSFNPDKAVAALRMGPWGTFRLAPDERLKAVNEKYKHRVIDELTAGGDNSLNRLRSRLHQTKN